MKYIADIRNVDTLEVHTLNIEGKDPQSTHKHILMNVLENNEECTRMTEETGSVVFEENAGFFTTFAKES